MTEESEDMGTFARIDQAAERIEELVRAGRTDAVSAIRYVVDLTSMVREFSDGDTIVACALNTIETLLDLLENPPGFSNVVAPAGSMHHVPTWLGLGIIDMNRRARLAGHSGPLSIRVPESVGRDMGVAPGQAARIHGVRVEVDDEAKS